MVLYSNNKNIEAVNLKALEEVKTMKTLIAEIKKDEKLSETDKAVKIKKYEEKIEAVQAKCKETSASLKSELKEDSKKAKQRFSS